MQKPKIIPFFFIRHKQFLQILIELKKKSEKHLLQIMSSGWKFAPPTQGWLKQIGQIVDFFMFVRGLPSNKRGTTQGWT